MRLSWIAAIAATALLSAAPAQAQRLDRRVRIINNTSFTMINFQASNVRRKTWEEDILGRRVVRPGGTFVANINDGSGYCMFDLRARFQGGRQAVRRNINVCKVTSWTIHN